MALVYQHRKPGHLEPFYIGITDKDRTRPYRTSRPNSPLWTKIYKKYGMEVDILIDGCTYDEAKEVEIGLIAAYGRIDLGTGILANMTDGGDGVIGVVVTEETRKKISKNSTGENNGMFGKGYKLSGENNGMFGKGYLILGDKNPRAKSVVIKYISGKTKEFKTRNEAADYLKVARNSLSLIISGTRKLYKRFKQDGIVCIKYKNAS